MMARPQFYPAVENLLFSESEKRLENGRRPEPQARAEKLLRRRNNLRKEFDGLGREVRKGKEGFDGDNRSY